MISPNSRFMPAGFAYLGTLLLLGLGVFGLALSFVSNSWILDFVGIPSMRLFALTGIFVVAAYGISKTRTPNFVYLATLAVIFVASLLSSTTASPLGDQEQWIRQSTSPEVWLSEPYANVIQKIVVGLTSDTKYLGYLAPLAGVVVAAVFFASSQFLGSSSKAKNYLIPMFFIGLGSLFLYSIGIVENTILSTPLLMAFLYFALKYLQHVGKKSYLLIASICLGGAVLVHGQNLFMLPALVALPFIAERVWNSKSLKLSLFTATAFVAVVVLGLLVLFFSGLRLGVGNATGGAAGGAFVPLTESGMGQFDRFTMFSLEHVAEFGVIVFVAVPLSILLPIYYLMRVLQRKKFDSQFLQSSSSIFLSMATLCYLLFAFLWNFDLGAPRDLDLMVTMSLPLALFTFLQLNKIFQNQTWLFVYLMLGQIIFTMSCFASLKTGYPFQHIVGL